MNSRTLTLAALLLFAATGCDSGTRHKATTPQASTAGAVNVLQTPTSSPPTSGTSGTSATTSATPFAGASASVTAGITSAMSAAVGTGSVGFPSTPVASTPTAGTTPAGTTPAASTPAASTPAAGGAGAVAPVPATTGAQLWGTIPPDPETGFDGTLYLPGERLVPGSIIHVDVNGIPTKVLPSTFHSSELLGVYVNLTVPADYTFTAVAPDGSQSTPVTFTVRDGGVQALFGLTQPDVQMVFPSTLDTQFSGTMWLMGRGFVAGCTATLTVNNVPVAVVPLVYLNERTVGLVLATPLPGNVTITVTNPTLLSSQPLTIPVGQVAPSGSAAPTAYGPGAITSPFLGTVHVTGTDIMLGAWTELRAAGTTQIISATPLIRVSSNEAWWTLAYPQPGTYEARVVNPNGQASTWWTFDVN